MQDIERYRARKRAYIKKPEVREKRRIEQQNWRNKNRAHYNQWSRRRYRKHTKRVLAINWKSYYKNRYGLTPEQARSMKRSTPCGICGNIKPRMHIDHDHSRKDPHYRGVLCVTCNVHLGWIEKVGITNVEKYLNV